MDISKLIFNVGVFFIMMLPGVILKKFRMCSDTFGKGLSNLVLYIAQPALILYAYIACSNRFVDVWQNVLVVFVFSLIAHGLFAVVAMKCFGACPDSRRKMLRFATVFSNAAFMGIPLVEAILGDEAAIYASIYNITFNLFLWTFGVHLCTKVEGADIDGDGDSDIRDAHLSASSNIKREGGLLKVAVHPVIIASVLGLVLLICGVKVSDFEAIGLSIVTESLYMLKNLVAPLSMVVIGLRLPDVKFKGTLKDKGMYLFLALRHLILPLAVLGIIKLVTLVGVPISNDALIVLMIMAATPAATSATMFAEKYDCDAEYVSRLVVISTILCIATMPLVVFLAQL